MFRFQMTVAGEVQMDRGLARFTEGIADWRPIWPVFSDSFYAHLRLQFSHEGIGLTGKWKPLSEKYAEWKAKHFPGRKILERTGRLVRSLTKAHAEGGVYEATPKKLTIDSTIPYAIFHQTGVPAHHLPRRPEFDFDEPVKRELMRIAQEYLIQIASQAGLRRGLTPTEVSHLEAIRHKYPHWPMPWERGGE